MNKLLHALDNLIMPDRSVREINRKIEKHLVNFPLESLNTHYISDIYSKANIC
ncbi:hypothetical protein BMS3Abin17_01026 [archaeon BMS3Abin17]|nr:hypothetical protein BMS3Abin17_01026 [archaeon BMS3Abin17]